MFVRRFVVVGNNRCMNPFAHYNFITFALITLIEMVSSASIDQPASLSSGLFAADLLGHIAKNKATENVVFSPISIQTALAMTYLGAEGRTAEELKNGLHLSSDDKDEVGETFSQILNKNAGQAKWNIANRIFVSSALQLKADFNTRSEKYFNSGAEALDFNKTPLEAIETINSWVESQTGNKIKELMKPGSVGEDTAAVIVNAIYFKGKWQHQFSKIDTSKNAFWISQNESVSVDTMIKSKRFKYGVFPELDATAIEMPYKESDLSMMLILPSQREGLADLESKLSSISINDLSSKMTPRKVDVMLPKFKIEFSTKLASVLKEMGIRSIFGNAELPGIFQSGPPVKVSDVQHKAYIDVNEAGSEAAAASFVTTYFTSANSNQKYFNVDHPFLFAIKDSDVVYFIGHVAKP